ncbi:MAG: hypothetical protein JXQ27_05505 [Acidobacteria bacterium]|nr:hypothetical protein [Acidobacteriota bacterium]
MLVLIPVLSLVTISRPDQESRPPAPGAGGTRQVSGRELRDAPVSITIRERTLSLSAILWRDFSPSMPPVANGHPMMAIFTVRCADGHPFPAGVRVDQAWVLFGDKIWAIRDPEEQDETDPTYTDAAGHYRNRPDSSVFRVVARNGPKWTPGIRVDVVVRLTDSRGCHHFLCAPQQGVGRIN